MKRLVKMILRNSSTFFPGRHQERDRGREADRRQDKEHGGHDRILQEQIHRKAGVRQERPQRRVGEYRVTTMTSLCDSLSVTV